MVIYFSLRIFYRLKLELFNLLGRKKKIEKKRKVKKIRGKSFEVKSNNIIKGDVSSVFFFLK